MKSRKIRIITMSVCLLISCILPLSSLWASAKQIMNVSLTVSYTPDVVANVTVNITKDGYEGYSYSQVLFDNFSQGVFNGRFGNTAILLSNADKTQIVTELNSSCNISFTITNYTSGQNMDATLKIVGGDASTFDAGVSILQTDGSPLETDLNTPTIIAPHSTPIVYHSESTEQFKLKSMFYNSCAYLKLVLTTSSN